MNTELTPMIETPSPDLLDQVESAFATVRENELLAIAALRTKFAVYARYGRFIPIAWLKDQWGIERNLFYKKDAKKVRGLLVRDEFRSGDGEYSGWRIYLTEYGGWLYTRRSGEWSEYEGTTASWGCAHSVDDSECHEGAITPMKDAEVGDLSKITHGVSEALRDLCAELPQRLEKLRMRAEKAQKLLEALS